MGLIKAATYFGLEGKIMKKQTCIICSIARGKRVCKLNNNALICPICCAKTRIPECEGCIYYTQAEQFSKAKIKAQKSKHFIMRIDPEVDEAVDRALVMVERGNISSGERIISELLVKYPDIHTVQYAMGVVCAFKGKYDKAIAYFDKAIDIFPYFVEAWFNKGTSHQKKLEVSEMIRAFQKVVELGDPGEDFVKQAKNMINKFEKRIRKESGLNLEGYLKSSDKFNQAYALMEIRQWQKAIIGFQQVLSMNPNHVQSYGNMGICYANIGEKQKALAALNKALELDPNYEPALVNRNVVMSLEEGHKLPPTKVASVEYYRDVFLKEKSHFGG
jgi:tetratricopeptide (TPR) repeat protein